MLSPQTIADRETAHVTRAFALAAALALAGCAAGQTRRWGDPAAASWPQVDSAAVSARLVADDYPPFPSSSTRDAIARRGGGVYTLRVKLCVARTGEPALVEVVRTSGDPDLDADAMTVVRAWRFQPAERDECTTIHLGYRINR